MTLEKSKNIFRPFTSYGEDEYLKLQGRDKDEEELIRLILRSREDKSVSVLTAESGDGKTSLLRARIIEDFTEMGFKAAYFDDVSEALYYLNTEFNNEIELKSKNTWQSSGISHYEWETNRYLVIMDQIERSLSEDKIKNLEALLKQVRDLVNEDEYHNRIIYFIFSIPDLFVHKLGQVLSTFLIEPRIYFLKKVDIKLVVISILKQENISYDERIINDITNYLLSSKSADITNVHILFQMLLNTDKLLLVDKELIVRTYKSVESMIEYFVKNYFKDKFSYLIDMDKKLLKRACNYDGKGTHRVYVKKGEEERLQLLAEKNFIRLYENNMTYEFVHDILARKFYDSVLGEHDREINALLEKIHIDSLDSESLLVIQRIKDEIAANELEDADIANLIFAYMMNKEIADEVGYWMRKYVKPDIIIEKLVQRIEKSVNMSGIIYVNMLSVTKRIPILFECAEERRDLDKMIKKLWHLSEESISYRSRCIASSIIEKIGYSAEDDEVEIPVTFSQIYYKTLIEPKYEELYREAYCYLMHYELVDILIDEKQMSRVHFQHILSIFSMTDKKAKFYSYEYTKNEIDYVKFEIIVSLITPKIVEVLKSVHDDALMELRHGNVSFVSRKPGYEKCGVRMDINTEINFEMLLKFSYKEEVDILFQKEEREIPVIFLKKKKVDSHRIFTKTDIMSIIRQYKIHFVNNYYSKEFKKSLLMKVPKTSQKEMAWLVAKDELEIFFGEKYLSSDLSKCVPSKIRGIRMSMLYVTLCYLNYLNLQLYCESKFSRAKIILLQTEDLIKNTGLYDRFYIELEGNGSKQKFDPDGIAGFKSSNHMTVDFHLVTKKEKIKAKNYSVKREVEFLGNGSPAIAISIGSVADCILEEYKDSFSFRIMWDDKVSRVSQAVDAWEYELNKILVVIKENLFITDLFVFGDIMKCRKTVQILKHYCKDGGYLILPNKWKDLNEIETDGSMQYFQSFNLKLLERVRLNIIQFETDVPADELEVQVSEYFLQNYNSVMNVEVIDTVENFESNQIERKCEEYLKSINSYTTGKKFYPSD